MRKHTDPDRGLSGYHLKPPTISKEKLEEIQELPHLKDKPIKYLLK